MGACSQRRRWITDLDKRLSRGGHRQLAPQSGHGRNRHTLQFLWQWVLYLLFQI
jgi:hypothetical protein